MNRLSKYFLLILSMIASSQTHPMLRTAVRALRPLTATRSTAAAAAAATVRAPKTFSVPRHACKAASQPRPYLQPAASRPSGDKKTISRKLIAGGALLGAAAITLVSSCAKAEAEYSQSEDQKRLDLVEKVIAATLNSCAVAKRDLLLEIEQKPWGKISKKKLDEWQAREEEITKQLMTELGVDRAELNNKAKILAQMPDYTDYIYLMGKKLSSIEPSQDIPTPIPSHLLGLIHEVINEFHLNPKFILIDGNPRIGTTTATNSFININPVDWHLEPDQFKAIIAHELTHMLYSDSPNHTFLSQLARNQHKKLNMSLMRELCRIHEDRADAFPVFINPEYALVRANYFLTPNQLPLLNHIYQKYLKPIITTNPSAVAHSPNLDRAQNFLNLYKEIYPDATPLNVNYPKTITRDIAYATWAAGLAAFAIKIIIGFAKKNNG